MSQKGHVLLIVLLIAAATFGYLIYSGKINLPQEQTDQQATETSKVNETARRYSSDVEVGRIKKTPLLEQAADYKIYKNADPKFEIKYPNSWSIIENTKSLFENGEIVTFSIVGKTQKKQTELYDGAYLAIAKPIYSKEDIKSYLYDKYGKKDVNGYLIKYSEEVVNDITYQKVFSCGLGCFNNYFTKRGDYIYGFIL